MLKLGRLVFLSGALVLLTTLACVGGPGQLPDDDGQNNQPQQQQGGGTGNTTTTTSPPSANGSGGSTGGGSAGGSSGSSGTGTSVKRTIAANEFNQSCSGDSATECVARFFGGTCTPCQCPTAAISSGEAAKYDKLMAERQAGCAIPDIACSPCKPITAICVANTCQIANSAPDGG